MDLQRGLTLAEMGRHREAVEVLTRSTSTRAFWTGHVARGRSREQLGRLDAALLDFDAALAMRSQVEVYLERGRLQSRLGRLDVAEAGYRDALRTLGPATGVVEGGTATDFFRTAPVPGAATPFTAWIVGDSGVNGVAKFDVRDAMLAHAGARPPDLFPHVGDLACEDGTDAEITDSR